MEKNLIVYYSFTKNTKKIADMICKALDADIFEIETVKPYTGSYNDVVSQGQREVNSGFKPEIKPITVNLEEYDKILIGTPVWWYTYAPAVAAFLAKYPLENKTVIPFITNGGWIGHTVKDFKQACPKSKVINAIDIVFEGSELRTSEKELKKWIETL